MQIALATRQIETNITDVRKSGGILMNATAVKVLSSNIYTDKPLAIVREISCNARDANPNRAFVIAAPSGSNPHLLIRDYGPGLSDDDCMVLYTTFFDSRKAHSNDSIGGFGLGSKSPLSYTDMFTVRSIQNGRSRSFVIFKDANYELKVTPQEPINTQEEDGLEVLVPVRREDFHLFNAAIAKTLRHFPAGSFKVFGVSVTPTTFKVDYGSWAIYAESMPTVAKMGPVAYKIDWTKVFGDQAGQYGQRDKYPVEGLEFRFNIGDLDIAPSREVLSYDRATIKKLQDAYARMVADLRADVLRREAKATTRWDMAQTRKQIRSDMSHVWGLLNLPSDYGYFTLESTAGHTFERFARGSLRKKTPEKVTVKEARYGWQTYDRFQLVWLDVEKNPRINARLREHDKDGEYLLFGPDKWADRKAASLDLGGVPDEAWKNLSEFTLPEVQRAAPSGDAIVFRVNRYRGGWDNQPDFRQSKWREWENETSTVVYIAMKGAKPENAEEAKLLDSPLIKDGNVKCIGLPKRIREENQLPANFIPITDYVQKQIDDYVLRFPQTWRHLAAMEEIGRLDHTYRNLVAMARAGAKANDPYWVGLVQRVNELYDYDKSKVADDFGISVLRYHADQNLPAVPDLHAWIAEMETKRPALRILLPRLGSLRREEYDLALKMMSVEIVN